ncbi:hypothetical protein OROHE_004369 [Orobanche hederae]
MGWKVRTPGDFIPPGKLTPDYGSNNEYFTIRLHHSGRFLNLGHMVYNGGEISHIDWYSQDEMSSLELGFMLGEIGAVYGVLEYYYSPDSRDHCVNIIQIVGDREAIEMCKFVDGDKLVGVVVSQSTLTNQTMSSLDVVETQSTLLDILEPLDYVGGDEQDEFEDSESEDSGQDDEQVGDENIAKSNENVEGENIYSGILDSVYDFEDSGGSDWKVTCGEDSVLSDPIFDSDYQLSGDSKLFDENIDLEVERFHQDLDIRNNYKWTIMSDKQKGLIDAVNEVFEESEHRYCVMHLYNNFKKDHKGLALKICCGLISIFRAQETQQSTVGEGTSGVKKDTKGKAKCANQGESKKTSKKKLKSSIVTSVQAKQAAAASRVQSRARKNAPAPTTKAVVPSKNALPPKNTNTLKKQASLPKKIKTIESYGEVVISLAQETVKQVIPSNYPTV